MKISAFMPVTNAVARGDTFIEAIKTHLYFADELVVVDGGSTDGTLEEVAQINDPRIKIVHFDWPKEGWSWTQFCKTWNRGLVACTGDWVAAGESDHIFHKKDIPRLLDELKREEEAGRAVVKVQKLQSCHWQSWSSKSQMYYFLNKAKFPQIRYGYDPNNKTDLCHPIWWGGDMIDDIPQGVAIMERGPHEGLIGGTGVPLWNYLWTFKTFEMVVQERMKAARAWNMFPGFTQGYGKSFPTEEADVRVWISQQLESLQKKSNRFFDLKDHPEIMQQKLTSELKQDHIGAKIWAE